MRRAGCATYSNERRDTVREEGEVVGRAWWLVDGSTLGGTTRVASDVRARRGLGGRGRVEHRDLEDTVPVRAESELDAVRIHYVGVD